MTTVRGEIVETITEKVFFRHENEVSSELPATTEEVNISSGKNEVSSSTSERPHQYEVHEDFSEVITTQSTPLLPVHTTTPNPEEEKYLKVIPLGQEEHLDEDELNNLDRLTNDGNDLNYINSEEQSVLSKFKHDINDIDHEHSTEAEAKKPVIKDDFNSASTPKPLYEKLNKKDTYFGDKKDIYDKKYRTDKQADLTSDDKVSFEKEKPVTEGFSFAGFSRCASGQFQCINGTSIKDGSYCIPKSDRCDSVDHCSDASDETDCIKEGCPNNFQCANGQCLKRHLVCDGILNCNDGSDELNCGKHINFTNFSFDCLKCY